MTNWPVAGGTVRDVAVERGLRDIRRRGGELERAVGEIKKEGLPPSGHAGGVLKGEYPNPEFAKEPAYKAELENETTARKEVDAILKGEIETEKSSRETGDNERVKGPASSTEGDIAVFSGTTGKIIKDGGKTVAQVLARENHTGTQTASTISDFDTQVRKSRLDQMAAPGANVSWAEKKITNLLDPTEALDAANKSYVDTAASAAAAGLSIKNPVAYASTKNIAVNFATALELRGELPLEIDGATTFAKGTRLLLKNQTTKSRNGIWEVVKEEAFGGTGTFGGEGKFGIVLEEEEWVLKRTSDADSETEVKQGMYVPVTKGTTNAGTAWTLSTPDPIVIGTTSQEFSPYTAIPGGAAGGDLTGTYPNPTVGVGKITSSKIANGSILDIDVAEEAGIKYEKLALTGSVADTDLVSPNSAIYKTICMGARPFNTALGAGTYFLAYNTGASSQSGVNSPNQVLPYFYFAKADYEVAGKTTKLRMRAQIGVNATVPTQTFTIGMYPLTWGGGANELKVTAGTVVSGSTVAIASPSANALSQGNSGDFTIPADGAYAIAVVISATMTTNSAISISAQLQVHNT